MTSETRNDMPGWMRCSARGCPNRWTQNFGRRLCSEHAGLGAKAAPARQPSLLSMPTLREAVRPYSEPVEREAEF